MTFDYSHPLAKPQHEAIVKAPTRAELILIDSLNQAAVKQGAKDRAIRLGDVVPMRQPPA